MQAQSDQSTPMAMPSNIKRFIVRDAWKDYEVTLEVNLDILTVERATMINTFWTEHADRLAEHDGDVVKTVIQLFGQNAICTFLQDGGASFSLIPDWVCNSQSRDLRSQEGWGGEGPEDEDNGVFGWCGIRAIRAGVDMPSFDDMELKELPV
ncbi:DUF2528 family protein [Pseudomonas citronellolis]|uniref:DUF2528 family protein n=1 Tax=Pseudomonas citronellolis TaxID=53408 RepID=UPI0023E408DF|nr:DUF2528 family protein [Pseudomonas citronellolis]MDF3935329.1 DUF2528 family protein [Pseudomonas citronellolis]